jgi:act minimal PKS ketosynthase (KS/KS alpha)
VRVRAGRPGYPAHREPARDPECDLDYVPGDAREIPVNTVLNIGSGFGGFQTAIVLTSSRRAA